MSGSDALANRYNIVRFYGATINDNTKEYNLVLGEYHTSMHMYMMYVPGLWGTDIVVPLGLFTSQVDTAVVFMLHHHLQCSAVDHI